MNRIKLSIVTIGLLISGFSYAQISTNKPTESSLNGSNFFMDASRFNNEKNDLGKGLGFPKVDLTKFIFDTTVIDQFKIYSDFDGMLVYNSAKGKTALSQGQEVNIEPGFYYFSNPGNPGNITNGKWIRLITDLPGQGTDISIYTNNGSLTNNRNANLNGYNLGFTGNGNVGVGTDSPTSKLNVRGGALNIGDLQLYAGGLQVQNQDAAKPIFNAYGTDSIERVRITNNGNVGIGTGSPTQKLDVEGTARVREKIMVGTEWTGGGALSIRNNVATENIASFVGSDNTFKAVLKNNGNLGVGTESPISKLNVRDGIINVGTLTEYAGGLQVQNQNASKPIFIAYGTDNADKMVITNIGNVGVSISSPTQKLDVNGTARVREKMMVGTDWTGGGALSIRNNVATENIASFVGSDNTFKAVLKNNGNLGVGTESPISKLNVRDGIINVGTLTEYAGGLQIQNQNASKPVFIAYGTDNVDKMVITNNGNIGIGTGSPTQKLDVNGTARFRSVPDGNTENDKVLVIDDSGVIKKSSLPPSPSFALYATSNNYVDRSANDVARALDMNSTGKIYSEYIERINGNTFRVKKNGAYTIEAWAQFSNVPITNEGGNRVGCTLRVNYGGSYVQLVGNRWQESTGTANVAKTVILNSGQLISTETRCERTGNQQYQTAPGSSIFITYLPL